MISLQQKLRAANQITLALLGTDVTPADVSAALDRACSGWSEFDRKDVLLIAEHTADATGDAFFEASNAKGGFTEIMGFAISDYYLLSRLRHVRLGEPVISDGERRQTTLDRLLYYPDSRVGQQ